MIERQELTRKYDDGIHDTYRRKRKKMNTQEYTRRDTYESMYRTKEDIDGIHMTSYYHITMMERKKREDDDTT